MSAPAISQHLRVLEKARLVERHRRAQWRVCRISPEPLEAAAEWVARNRLEWQARFDLLDEVLTELGRTQEEDER